MDPLETHTYVKRGNNGQLTANLAQMDAGMTAHREADPQGAIVMDLVREELVTTCLAARTKNSVLRELVGMAQRSGLLYDEHALLEAFRRPGRSLPAVGLAAWHQPPAEHRGGDLDRLAPVRRRLGGGALAGGLRCLGTARRRPAGFRLHAGRGGSPGQGAVVKRTREPWNRRRTRSRSAD